MIIYARLIEYQLNVNGTALLSTIQIQKLTNY
eukprot:UN06084